MAFHAPFENWQSVEVVDNNVAAQWAKEFGD
jgi:hypothetical protein